MALNIPTGFAQVSWLFTGSAVPEGAAVTCGVDSGSLTTPEAIANVAKDAWVAGLAKIQHETCTLSAVRVKMGPVDTGPSAEVSVNLAGTATGSPVPPNVAVLVRKVTILGGRQGRGRMYIPGFTEADVDGSGNMTGPYLAVVQGHAQATFDEFVTQGLFPVLFHDGAGPVVAPTTITAFQVDGKVATQRRRLRK